MEASEMAERLVQVEQRSKSNTNRIDDLERNYDLQNAIRGDDYRRNHRRGSGACDAVKEGEQYAIDAG
mgnify:CR=1 FL=1